MKSLRIAFDKYAFFKVTAWEAIKNIAYIDQADLFTHFTISLREGKY